MANRAPNRDLVDRYDGRDGDGVRRQYFRRFNRVERWKWGFVFEEREYCDWEGWDDGEECGEWG